MKNVSFRHAREKIGVPDIYQLDDLFSKHLFQIKIVVSTKRLRYELNLRRNITIIQRNSASGETTFIQILNDYLSGRIGPWTEVLCDRKCAVLSDDTESVLARM